MNAWLRQRLEDSHVICKRGTWNPQDFSKEQAKDSKKKSGSVVENKGKKAHKEQVRLSGCSLRAGRTDVLERFSHVMSVPVVT